MLIYCLVLSLAKFIIQAAVMHSLILTGRLLRGAADASSSQSFTKEEEVSPRKNQAAATRVSIDVRQKCEVFSVFLDPNKRRENAS